MLHYIVFILETPLRLCFEDFVIDRMPNGTTFIPERKQTKNHHEKSETSSSFDNVYMFFGTIVAFFASSGSITHL